MPKGDNKVTINFTTEMKQLGDSKKGDLYLSFLTALAFLQYYKNEFIAKYGQECYEAHINRYSIPAIEVRNNSAQKKKDNLERQKHDLDIREKELAVKLKYMEAIANRANDIHNTYESKQELEAKKELLKNPEYIKLRDKKKSLDEFFRNAEREPNNPAYTQDAIDRAKEQRAANDKAIQDFLNKQAT